MTLSNSVLSQRAIIRNTIMTKNNSNIASFETISKPSGQSDKGSGFCGFPAGFTCGVATVREFGRVPGCLGISTHKITKKGKKEKKSGSLRPENWDISGGSVDFGFSIAEGVGIAFHGQDLPGNPDGLGGGNIRGKISGWSRSSRKRMRSFLFSSAPPEGWQTAGFTLTIPGDSLFLKFSDIKEQWRVFCQNIKRLGWCMVWRVEIQKRGMLHYHGIISHPPSVSDDDLESTLKRLWYRAIDRLPAPYSESVGGFISKSGKSLYKYKVVGKIAITESSVIKRSEFPGARDWYKKDGEFVKGKAVDVQFKGDTSSWFRYLIDHSTKVKQEQVAQDIGRHWGVVNRKMFCERETIDVNALDRKTYFRVRRWMRRLRSPVCREDKAPFGKKLRKVPAGCYAGSRVFFGSSETYKRMILYATELRKKELEVKENSGI